MIDQKLTIELLKDKISFLEEEVWNKIQYLKNAYKKFGRTFEQFAPFTKYFTKEEKENFKFLGQPIDGVIFSKDKITFVEIKTGNSQFTKSQKRVRKLIQEKKIEFREVRY